MKNDITKKIEEFIESKSKAKHRNASFDYCYNYFRTTEDLTADAEKSCLALGFFLASWGMYRGSSFILQKSGKHLKPTIEYIASLKKSKKAVWEIDVDKYDEKNRQEILTIYEEIKKALVKDGHADLTLVTKVLLGVFGFVPAFDQYFCTTFREIADGKCGFYTMNDKALVCIKEFYEANKDEIDKLSQETFTTDFITGKKTTTIYYPKAKIIDMYGFQFGIDNKDKEAIKK